MAGREFAGIPKKSGNRTTTASFMDDLGADGASGKALSTPGPGSDDASGEPPGKPG
ncbi:hypothetical protein [Nocardia jinanensis]|uniref:Uncharacterized protein n=1 Tax=Nocardia jinanensis TaxID=382504 RepID=A0A917RP02_9NOCA|nr:hypothetical protein [Nocardia jinanensis]GGL17668.1 hypothetical protein GCM10011588_35500 [Nocardia jinanensis]